jgi:hypothetical protein
VLEAVLKTEIAQQSASKLQLTHLMRAIANPRQRVRNQSGFNLLLASYQRKATPATSLICQQQVANPDELDENFVIGLLTGDLRINQPTCCRKMRTDKDSNPNRFGKLPVNDKPENTLNLSHAEQYHELKVA